MSSLRLSFALIAVSLAFGSAPGLAKGNPHRKVKNGVGNCIFSTSPLEFEQEDKYQGIASQFRWPDVVHARCYYGKKLAAYGKAGKKKNELRDERAYRIKLEIRSLHTPKGKGKKAEAVSMPSNTMRIIQDGEDEWDTREYDLDPASKKCLFKSPVTPSGCVELDLAMRELALLESKPTPYTGEVCLTTFVEHVDKTVGQAGSGSVEDVKEQTVLAAGCFQYTSSDKPPGLPGIPLPPPSDADKKATAPGEGAP